LADSNTVQDMLGQKLELMRRFCSLTELLLKALDSEDMQKFNELLEARQEIINQVNKLDEVNAGNPAAGADANPVNSNQPGEMQQIRRKIQECLLRAREMDGQMQTFIEQRFRNMAKNMGNVRVARRAETMYRKKATSQHGYFVDKKK
jgi:hypothetical protein